MNIVALSTLPRFWGSDSLTWRPDRWITKDGESMRLEDEQIYQPQYGAFIPFSSGPRVCPGKKFAQVEFVAVIARLFRRHRCSPVLLEGECWLDFRLPFSLTQPLSWTGEGGPQPPYLCLYIPLCRPTLFCNRVLFSN